jgi:serine protease Do
MAAESSGFRLARRVLKALAIGLGFVATLLSLMSVVGLLAENGWIRVLVALLVAVAVPAVLSDRLLPDDVERARGLPSDVFALTWIGFPVAFAVGFNAATRPMLAREADRLAAAGMTSAARATYLLAGVEPGAPSAASAPAASASNLDPPPPVAASSSAAIAPVAPATSAPAPPVPEPKAEASPADLFKRLAPAVVTVAVDFSKEGVEGGGTGFLIDTKGTIVTNHHVIDDAKKARIKFMSGSIFEEIDVLLEDSAADLALLRIALDKPKDGQPVKVDPLVLGDSDQIVVGERAISIGNPLGLEHTLTDGLISARRVYGGRQWIQTSVPISPGNSGGPLFDMRGRVVGVTTAQIRGFMGIGQNLNLAVPVNVLKRMLLPEYPSRRKLGSSGASSHW